MKNQDSRIRLTPAQILVIGFASIILMGSFLLNLPLASRSGQAIPYLDALFTSASAVCVAGLVVVETGTYWSTFGQIVILILIQIGGLGFMTMATLFFLMLGRRINLRERMLIQESLHMIDLAGLVRLIKYVIMVTLVIQATGALLLATRFSIDLGWQKGLYYGVFHAVSAFNNAGFDLFGDFPSLTGFVDDIMVNLVITTLVIMGGIGFTVLAELYDKRSIRFLSLHTKIVLIASGILISVGFLAIFLLEYSNPKTLGGLSITGKVLASYFQSVSPRTAGFSTLVTSDLHEATQFLMIILMFIGASPGSTGGGIRITTFAILVLAVWASIRGRADVEIFKRRIPKELVYKSLTITLVGIALITGITMILSITEAGHSTFLEVNFEVVSAFAPTGLSLGLTPKLTEFGQIIIILTMFLGRAGPLTVAVALAQKRHHSPVRYAEEKIMIG